MYMLENGPSPLVLSGQVSRLKRTDVLRHRHLWLQLICLPTLTLLPVKP